MIAVVTGVISSAATVAAIKVDIAWIKQVQSEIKEKLNHTEKRVSILEKRL